VLSILLLCSKEPDRCKAHAASTPTANAESVLHR